MDLYYSGDVHFDFSSASGKSLTALRSITFRAVSWFVPCWRRCVRLLWTGNLRSPLFSLLNPHPSFAVCALKSPLPCPSSSALPAQLSALSFASRTPPLCSKPPQTSGSFQTRSHHLFPTTSWPNATDISALHGSRLSPPTWGSRCCPVAPTTAPLWFHCFRSDLWPKSCAVQNDARWGKCWRNTSFVRNLIINWIAFVLLLLVRLLCLSQLTICLP